MDRVLVLSHAYQPLTTVSQKRAIKLITLGKVAVEVASDIEWRSMTVVIKIPLVVRLLHRLSHKYFATARLSRKNIMLRDNYTCQYCHVTLPSNELTIDHVTPRALNGKTEWTNVVTACVSCNKTKDNKPLHETNMVLKTKPKEPQMILLSVKLMRSSKRIPESWLDYFYWYGMLEK